MLLRGRPAYRVLLSAPADSATRSPEDPQAWPQDPARSTPGTGPGLSSPRLPRSPRPQSSLRPAPPPPPRSSLAVAHAPPARRSPPPIHSRSYPTPATPLRFDPIPLALTFGTTPPWTVDPARRALPSALRRRLSPRAPTLWLLVSDPADAARAVQIPRIRAWAARNASPMARRRALEEAAARTPPEQSPEPQVRTVSPPPRPGSRPVPPERHSRAWARAGEMTHLLSSEVEPPPVQASAPPARAPSPAGRPPVSRAASLPPLGRGAAPPPPSREALVAALAHDPFAPQPPLPTSAPRPRSPGNTGPRLPGQGSAPAPRHTNAATVGSPPRPSPASDSHYPLAVFDPVSPAHSPPPPAHPAPSSPVERVAKLSGRELLELLRELRAESPELSALLGEVRDALDDLRALEDLRRIP